MATRLQLARDEIIGFFDSTGTAVFKRREIERMLSEHRDEWRLAKGMSFNEFLDYLMKSRKLYRIELPFPHRKETRYTWGRVPLETVLLTLKPGCHFSHFTAAQLHELTDQDPRVLYLNHEQRPKPTSDMGLSQERIDLAFRRKPRKTRNVAMVKGGGKRATRVCLLNGKHTGYLGVAGRDVRLSDEKAVSLRLTDVERTLIDIAVRPFYSGGVGEVLRAYRRANSRASVNRLAGMLRKLGHVYPYHQAIGFYLEASGYEPKAIDLFYRGFDYEFDFYLDYGMKETEYVQRWRIHVPRGLKVIER